MARTSGGPVRKRQTTYRTELRKQSYNETSTARKMAELERSKPIREVSSRVNRNRAKAAQINFKMLSFLLIAIIVTARILVDYVTLQSEITTTTVEISVLEKRLNIIRTENAEMQNRILASIDLDEIARIATEELGMGYATVGQVVPFTSINGDYVQQKKEIPLE